jgi:hypothetical protein
MNYRRIIVAAFAGWVAFFLSGTLVFGLSPLASLYAPYPGVYRSQAAVMNYFPIGLASTFVAILVLAFIYAKGYGGGRGLVEGTRFGVLVGIFVVCAFVGDEYVTLNIGWKLAVAMAAGRLFEWCVVGAAVGAVYKPAATSRQMG